MLHKDFFKIFIKLFGLYGLSICFFTIVPGLITAVTHFGDWESETLLLGFTILPVLIFLFIVFKSGTIINWLKLDQGFEEEKIILGDLSTVNILKLASIIMGGLLIINNLPNFGTQIFYLFKDSVQHLPNKQRDYFPLGICAGKIVLGYLMMRNFVWVGKLLGVKE